MTDTLPPLPLPTWDDSDYCPPNDDAFSADQMRTYAIAVRDAAVAAERAKWQPNAERYRWLRDNPWPPILEVDITLHRNARWDAEIDAAMARATAPAEKE